MRKDLSRPNWCYIYVKCQCLLTKKFNKPTSSNQHSTDTIYFHHYKSQCLFKSAWPNTTHSAKSSALGDVLQSNSTGRPVDSSGRPIEIFIAFLYEIGNSKIFEANLQNSRGRSVESNWTSSRIQWMSKRNSIGRPLDQMIWAANNSKTVVRI